MSRRNVVSIFTLYLLCGFILQAFALTTYELPFLCNNNQSKVIKVSSPDYGSGSSGILRNSFAGSYFSGSSCSVILVPKPRDSILLTLRKLDLRPNCKDSVTIMTSKYTQTTRCGRHYDDRETDTFVSSSNMTIYFQSGSGFTIGYSGFEFVFTSFSTSIFCDRNDGLFQCNNFRCISKFLTCDGHNHCGDRSDQSNCGPSGGAIAGYVFGSIFLVIAITAGVVACVRRKRRVITTYGGIVNQTYGTGSVLHTPNPNMYPTAPPPPYTPQSGYNAAYKY